MSVNQGAEEKLVQCNGLNDYTGRLKVKKKTFLSQLKTAIYKNLRFYKLGGSCIVAIDAFFKIIVITLKSNWHEHRLVSLTSIRVMAE